MSPDEFRARRKALNMTQAELALVLNVSFRTIQQWEAGKPSPHRLAELALTTVESLDEAELLALLESQAESKP